MEQTKKTTKRIKETASLLFYKAQTSLRSPYYSEREEFVSNVLRRAIKAGCPTAEKVNATMGASNYKICDVTYAEALIIAESFENYVEPMFTITFYTSNGDIKISKHREFDQAEQLRKMGRLIKVEAEN